MNSVKLIAFGILGAFAFSNIASAEDLKAKEDFEARMNANYVGINFFDLVSKLGNPQKIEKFEDGTGSAIFLDFERIVTTYGGKKFAWQNLPLYPSRQLAEPLDGNIFSSEINPSTSDLHISKGINNYPNVKCARVFTINDDGIVTSFSYQGDACYHLK